MKFRDQIRASAQIYVETQGKNHGAREDFAIIQ